MAYNDYPNQMPMQMNGYYNSTQPTMPVPTMQTPLYNRAYAQQQYSQSQGQLMSDWVLGETAARAYPVPAGRMAILMDSEDTTCFYLKSVDNFGMPSPLRKFRFSEEALQSSQYSKTQQMDPNKYITKDEFEKMIDERVNRRLEEFTK